MAVEAQAKGETASWKFDEGDEIADDLTSVTLLGGGYRTEAWLAWHARLHCLVVAKLIRPDQVSDARARDSMAREAAVLEHLQHPAIVRCFGADLVGPRPHLVLEALDGPRLSTLLRRFGPLAPEQVVGLGLNIASALAYMHEMKYVHLDVKPRNLIMGASPRLIDLGVARRLDELRLLTSPIGTDPYMAPEQCAVETLTAIGPWSDVWGLSVTLYEATSGRMPFDEVSGGDRYPQLTELPAPLDGRVPEETSDLVLAGMNREPSERPELDQFVEVLERMYPAARAIARGRMRRRRR
jgi:serine/threonine-protein kinase